MILCVLDAHTDFINQGAISLARAHDPDGHRTLAAITKIDCANQFTIADHITRLGLNYVLVCTCYAHMHSFSSLIRLGGCQQNANSSTWGNVPSADLFWKLPAPALAGALPHARPRSWRACQSLLAHPLKSTVLYHQSST